MNRLALLLLGFGFALRIIFALILDFVDYFCEQSLFLRLYGYRNRFINSLSVFVRNRLTRFIGNGNKCGFDRCVRIDLGFVGKCSGNRKNYKRCNNGAGSNDNHIVFLGVFRFLFPF